MTDRREYRQGRFVYLLDDNNHTAWIQSGHIGRCKTYRVPTFVDIEGVRYTITSLEYPGFNDAKTLRHLVISDTIEYIDEHAFSSSRLYSIHIGAGLKTMDAWTFINCPKVSLTISPENPHMKIQDGFLVTNDRRELLMKLRFMRSCRIPDGVEKIRMHACCYSREIEEITFPSSLREIHDNSFSNLPKLKRLIIPNGLEKLTIQCFMNNESLEYVDLPATVQLMGGDVFMSCHNLKKLIIRSSELVKQHISYFEPEQYSNCRLYVPSEMLMAYRKDLFWGRFMYILPILDGGRIEGEIPDVSDYVSSVSYANREFVMSHGITHSK